MSVESVCILMIEDDPTDVELVREILSRCPARSFRLEAADGLAAALVRLSSGFADLILLDLNLPDSRGLQTFEQIHQHASHVPIIVLTGIQDEDLAASTIQQGAQDYLIKGQVDSKTLVRSIFNAIERARLQAELRNLSLIDDLTGLNNRRGFRALVEQELRHAYRQRTGYLLLFADVDDLKRINDTFGHAEGDLALIQAAEVLRHSFRDSDILARLGGDEFTAFASGVTDHSGAPMLPRLHEALASLNRRPGRRFSLSLSLGVAQFQPDYFVSVDQLLATADDALYKQKRRSPSLTLASSGHPVIVSSVRTALREGRR